MTNCDACECPNACKSQGYCLWEQQGIGGEYRGPLTAAMIVILMLLILVTMLAIVTTAREFFTSSGTL